MRKYPLHGAGYIYLLHMVQTFSSVPHWARRQDGTEYILCSDINVWASLLWLLLFGRWELRWIFSASTGDAADSIGLVICMVETMVTNWGYVSGTPLPRRIIYLCHRGFSSGFHFFWYFLYINVTFWRYSNAYTMSRLTYPASSTSLLWNPLESRLARRGHCW